MTRSHDDIRTLLFSPRPVPAETPVSYLFRIAAENSTEIATIVGHLTGTRRTPHHTDDAYFNPAALACLAALTGRPSQRLQQAMPSLRITHAPEDLQPRITLIPGRDPERPFPACRHCMARRSVIHPVIINLPPHIAMCQPHALWLRGPALDLTACPEIARAQAHHARLARRHTDPAANAIEHAVKILGGWHGHPTLTSRWEHRRHALGLAHSTDPSIEHAVVYPELVTLTALIASPHWNRLAAGPGEAHDRFLAEAGYRLGLDDMTRAPDHDPLLRWLHAHRRRNGNDLQESPDRLRPQTLRLSHWI